MNYKIFILFAIALLCQNNANSQNIKFKDENLKIALLELGYDFNKNKEIEISEIDTVTNLRVAKRKIKQLDDMIYFKSLKIFNAMTNQVTNLDVFFNNSTIEEIYIGENQLGKKLTLKGLKNLKGLYAFRNGLEEIELIKTENIQSLYLQGNLFETLNVRNLPKLKSLQLTECENLKEIDVSSNQELVQLYLTYTAISNLDISKNPLIKTLYVEKNVKIIKANQSTVKPMPQFKGYN